MGVPKFYRWISERYPCLSQVIKEYQIPTFDNLYLDMNGIIHVCSHPNDGDATFRISEAQMFSDIFHYIEFLFRTISPKKAFFMAVDGVAPRAKMNQQRGRRFRSAREAEDLIKKALLAGKELPKEERFDSNCITPGTGFMARLDKQLQHFVSKKISEDPAWKNVRVIYSGHEVPGEGEHKIMDFIRYEKSQPEFEPNTRHCLYGLDADLVMLGMASHEPHFSLLREEVRFGKANANKRTNLPEAQTFHLLHLSLLREYIGHEFAPLKDTLPFPFDLECIIDDWILMGFLVGNDFIPHLPNMHIKQDVLPFLYKTYIKVMPQLSGYINLSGDLHMERFETYLKAVSEFDFEQFEEKDMSLKWMKDKSKGRKERKKEETEPLYALLGIGDKSLEELQKDLGIPDVPEMYREERIPDADEIFEADFTRDKDMYYREKFAFDTVNADTMATVSYSYVVGIQWILKYYFSGVPSWSWYYPFHYAPYVSDLKNISHLSIQFDKGSPFLPFQQLLAVLPAASKTILPAALQDLMVNETSPILDYYPVDFETDLNGKQQDWEAVVLIPFIDEDCLLNAMDPLLERLNEDEQIRNAHGPCREYAFNGTKMGAVLRSPWPQVFPDLQCCRVEETLLPSDPYPLDPSERVTGLCKGVKLDVFYPGFPTLQHIPYRASLQYWNVKVFQASSRGENMALTLLKEATDSPMGENPELLRTTAKDIIGQVCHVGWPHLVEAKVVAVKTKNLKIYAVFDEFGNLTQVKEWTQTERDVKAFRTYVEDIHSSYKGKNGIDLGEIDVIVDVRELEGEQFVPDRNGPKGSVVMVKRFSNTISTYAHQTLVKDIARHASDYSSSIKSLADLYPPKMDVFLLEPSYYGCQAEVERVDMESEQPGVFVTVKVTPEPVIKKSILTSEKLMSSFYPARTLAGILHVPTTVVSRITSSMWCQRGSRGNCREKPRVKFGLNIKNSGKKEELVGYTQLFEDGKELALKGWCYSDAVINMLAEYQRKFPSMFDFLKDHPSDDLYYESDLFPGITTGDESLTALSAWLKQLPTAGAQLVPCGSESMTGLQMKAMEETVESFFKNKPPTKSLPGIKIDPRYIYRPLSNNHANIIPDQNVEFYLLDRVINVSTCGAVPYGLRGTVTGIHYTEKVRYEVVWDETFPGGLQCRCSSNRGYRVPAHTVINLTHGQSIKGSNRRVSGPVTSTIKSQHSYAASVGGKRWDHKHQQPPQQTPPGKKTATATSSSSRQKTSPSGSKEQKTKAASNLTDFDDGSPIPSVTLSSSLPSGKKGQLQPGKVKILAPKSGTPVSRHSAGSKGSPKPSPKTTEFASMVKEMESHSTKSPKPRHQSKKTDGTTGKRSETSTGKQKSRTEEGQKPSSTFSVAAEKLDMITSDTIPGQGDQLDDATSVQPSSTVGSKGEKPLADSVAALFHSATSQGDGPPLLGNPPMVHPVTSRPPNAPLLPTPVRGVPPYPGPPRPGRSPGYYSASQQWYSSYHQPGGPYSDSQSSWRPPPSSRGGTRFTSPHSAPVQYTSYPHSAPHSSPHSAPHAHMPPAFDEPRKPTNQAKPLKPTAKTFVPTSVLRKKAHTKQTTEPKEQQEVCTTDKTSEMDHFQSLLDKLSVSAPSSESQSEEISRQTQSAAVDHKVELDKVNVKDQDLTPLQNSRSIEQNSGMADSEGKTQPSAPPSDVLGTDEATNTGMQQEGDRPSGQVKTEHVPYDLPSVERPVSERDQSDSVAVGVVSDCGVAIVDIDDVIAPAEPDSTTTETLCNATAEVLSVGSKPMQVSATAQQRSDESNLQFNQDDQVTSNPMVSPPFLASESSLGMSANQIELECGKPPLSTEPESVQVTLVDTPGSSLPQYSSKDLQIVERHCLIGDENDPIDGDEGNDVEPVSETSKDVPSSIEGVLFTPEDSN